MHILRARSLRNWSVDAVVLTPNKCLPVECIVAAQVVNNTVVCTVVGLVQNVNLYEQSERSISVLHQKEVKVLTLVVSDT